MSLNINMFGATFNAVPCIAMPPETRTPIAAIFLPSGAAPSATLFPGSPPTQTPVLPTTRWPGMPCSFSSWRVTSSNSLTYATGPILSRRMLIIG